MEIKIDTHTHTIASGHAYNTIREMASMAARKGLEGLAITEHAPKMPGSCGLYYFQNLKVVPRQMENLRLLFGVELNILDENGTVDLPEDTIRSLDIAVASIHPPCYGRTSGKEENTRAYVNAMKKEFIDIIGHPDDGRYGRITIFLPGQPGRQELCWRSTTLLFGREASGKILMKMRWKCSTAVKSMVQWSPWAAMRMWMWIL